MKNKSIWYFLGIIFVIVLWEVSAIIFNNEIVLPTVTSTIKEFGILLGQKQTYLVLGATILRLMITIAACFIISLGLGVLSYKFKKLESFLEPVISVIRSIPVVAIIIVILMIAKVKYASIIISSLVVLPVMYNNILTGLHSISKGIKDDVKMLSGINYMVLKEVYIPLIIPYILLSLITSFGLGLKVIVMSEFIASPKFSIAREMSIAQANFDMDIIFAWTIIMVIFVLICEALTKRTLKKANDRVLQER